MRCFPGAAAFVLMLSPLLPAMPAAAQAPAALQNPQIEIVYGQPGNPNYRPIYDRLKRLQVLEELKQFLVPLRLPRKLTVQVDQCGAATRPYKPGGPATVCYELVEQIERVAAKTDENLREMVIVGTFVQAVFHEVASAVIDILQVPVWGRREDAADRLAGFIMLQFGEDVARQTVIGTGIFFEASGKTWTGSQFAEVNSPEPQRYFNFLCMAYGGAPKVFESLAKAEGDAKPILPEDRAERCAGEYAQVRKAFNLRIMPFVDPDLVIKVKASQWNNVGGGR
jgi:Putative metallopeptidase